MARRANAVTNGATQSPSPDNNAKTEQPPLPEVSASVWTKVGEGGRVVIPAEVRQALGIKPGSPVLLRVEGGELHALTTRQATRRAQQLAEPYIRRGVSVDDELIAERRAENAREERDVQATGSPLE